MNKIKLTEAKELLNNNISSIYSKQDVLDLLDRLDMGSNTEHITEIFNKIKTEFAHGLRCIEENIVDTDNIRLELYGKEIIIDNVDIEFENIESVLEEVLDSLEQDFEERN
jgi:Zn-dependent M32 family carboxypeptidase